MRLNFFSLNMVLPNLYLPNIEFSDDDFPAIAQFMRMATPSKAKINPYNQLLNLFSVSVSANNPSLPIAALTAYADGLPKAHWLRADPVSLQVDWAKVFMMGHADLLLRPEEVSLFLQAINQHLLNDQLAIIAPHPKRWYIQLPSCPDMKTHNYHSLYGKSILEYLPTGRDSLFWRQRFNEIQMLLPHIKANQNRALAHQATVDAVWFWGEGMLPTVPRNKRWQKIVTDHAVAKGLALLSKSEIVDFENDLHAYLPAKNSTGEYLFCIEACELFSCDYERLLLLERAYFRPLMQCWQQTNCHQMILYLADGSWYALQRAHHRNKRILLWRKKLLGEN